MKTTLRLPTQDQYAFIEVEIEVSSVGDAVEAYNHAISLIRPQEGISEKDYNTFLDTFLQTNSGDVNIYEKMSQKQKDIIQAIKRSLKRIQAKNKTND